jgi:hypothetical protein
MDKHDKVLEKWRKEKRREAKAQREVRRRLAEREAQRDAAVVTPLRRPRLKRFRYVTLNKKMWGRKVTEQGVLEYQVNLNGWDVFVLRIVRDRKFEYYFTCIRLSVFRLKYVCELNEHEAISFNKTIADVVDIKFRAG